MEPFDRLESEVRSYCRTFPTVFSRSRGSSLWDESGRQYLDFFSGAGALNYGHNNPLLKRRILEYLEADGVAHSLDMATVAKRNFLERFERVVLRPRGLDHKVQFVGPTGTNAVEAALKLARKVTKRTSVVYFTDAYHGMTLGSLAVTGNASKRAGAGVPLQFTTPMPFDGYLGPDVDTVDVLATYLRPFAPLSGRGVAAFYPGQIVQADAFLREVEAGLPKLADKPALIFWGMQDQGFPRADLDKMKAAFPRHRMFELPDADHFFFEDSLAEMVPAITSFVAESTAAAR